MLKSSHIYIKKATADVPPHAEDVFWREKIDVGDHPVAVKAPKCVVREYETQAKC